MNGRLKLVYMLMRACMRESVYMFMLGCACMMERE